MIQGLFSAQVAIDTELPPVLNSIAVRGPQVCSEFLEDVRNEAYIRRISIARKFQYQKS
jgi:hypothetical protein